MVFFSNSNGVRCVTIRIGKTTSSGTVEEIGRRVGESYCKHWATPPEMARLRAALELPQADFVELTESFSLAADEDTWLPFGVWLLGHDRDGWDLFERVFGYDAADVRTTGVGNLVGHLERLELMFDPEFIAGFIRSVADSGSESLV